MFGLFRTLLALAVVFEHLGPTKYLGPYAVFGFYALSGYLMTLIMHATYGYTGQGMIRFAVNRWLRIFPIYYLAALLTLALVALLGESMVREFHQDMGLPRTTEEVLRNIGLVLSIHTDTRLVPPAWALTVECTYYLMLGLGLSRHFTVTMVWLVASLFYTGYLVAGDASFSYRYYTIAAASLPFSIGAAIYHFKARGLLSNPVLAGNGALVTLIACALLNYFLSLNGSKAAAVTLHFYANLAIMAMLVVHLIVRKPGRLRSFDRAVGDLSYPIYLIHFQAGLIVTALAPSLVRGEASFLAWSLPVVIGLAWIVTRLVEAPIEALRTTIKPAARA